MLYTPMPIDVAVVYCSIRTENSMIKSERGRNEGKGEMNSLWSDERPILYHGTL